MQSQKIYVEPEKNCLSAMMWMCWYVAVDLQGSQRQSALPKMAQRFC